MVQRYGIQVHVSRLRNYKQTNKLNNYYNLLVSNNKLLNCGKNIMAMVKVRVSTRVNSEVQNAYMARLNEYACLIENTACTLRTGVGAHLDSSACTLSLSFATSYIKSSLQRRNMVTVNGKFGKQWQLFNFMIMAASEAKPLNFPFDSPNHPKLIFCPDLYML